MKLISRFDMAVPCQAQQVKVNGLWLGCTDTAGVTWFIEDMPGWDDLELSDESGAMSWSDGGWVGPQWLSPKNFGMVLRVSAGFRRRKEVERAYEDLLSCLPCRDLSPVVVKTFGKTVAVEARVCTSIKAVRLSDTAWQINISFTAPNPVKYGADWDSGVLAWREWETGLPSRAGGLVFPAQFPTRFSAVETAGGIRFNVTGNDARGVITICGPVENVTVTSESGWRFRILEPVLSGEELTIDPARRLVSVDGSSRRGFFSGSWPQFNKGANRVIWSGSGSREARLRVRVIDIWR